MSKVLDLFGYDTQTEPSPDWAAVVGEQRCPFIDRRCYKVRKGQPEVAIGTCTVKYGDGPVIICPLRLLERRQVFTDCLHLLTGHEPGNEIHIVPEIRVPGGSIDYILASVRAGKIRDFVGIEIQTLDTTGTIWPERQRFLASKGFEGLAAADVESRKTYSMNWKMTAKTTLVQLHHKVRTFEGLSKHLVLVIQDRLLAYMEREFTFDHLNESRTSDPMHFHAYGMTTSGAGHRIDLTRRLSTDTAGIAKCLGLQSEAKVEMDVMSRRIEKKLSDHTRFDFPQPPPTIPVDAEE